MKLFGLLALTLAVLVNLIDCLRIRQFPPSGDLPGHPELKFFTVLQRDIRDVYVESNDGEGPLIPVEDTLLAVSQNHQIIGWLDGYHFRPIFNSYQQQITISIENGTTDVMDIENQFTRERSRTPPNVKKNLFYRSETPPYHNIIMRDRTETPPSDNTVIRERSRTPREQGHPIQGPPTTLLSDITSNLNDVTLNRDRSRTPQNLEKVNLDRPKIPRNYNKLVRERSRSPSKKDTPRNNQLNIQ